MNPKISIITPVWNGLPMIEECVASVLEQSFQDWEMLISDNGSTDGTRNYLKSLADPRIRVFEQSTNLGIFGNLNFLFQQASAPVAHILCADDLMLAHGIENIMKRWQQVDDDVAAIRFNSQDFVDSTCRGVRLIPRVLPKEITPENYAIYFYLFGNIMGNLSTASVRPHVVEELGWFNQEFPYAGDFEFWTRLAHRFKIFRDPIDVTLVRRHPGVASVYLNKHGELIAQNERICRSLYEKLTGTGCDWLLKLYGNLNLDSLQRNAGLRMWWDGKSTEYLKVVDRVADQSPVMYGRFGRWLVFFLSGGGRWGRVSVIKLLLPRT